MFKKISSRKLPHQKTVQMIATAHPSKIGKIKFDFHSTWLPIHTSPWILVPQNDSASATLPAFPQKTPSTRILVAGSGIPSFPAHSDPWNLFPDCPLLAPLFRTGRWGTRIAICGLSNFYTKRKNSFYIKRSDTSRNFLMFALRRNYPRCSIKIARLFMLFDFFSFWINTQKKVTMAIL